MTDQPEPPSRRDLAALVAAEAHLNVAVDAEWVESGFMAAAEFAALSAAVDKARTFLAAKRRRPPAAAPKEPT